MPDKMQELSLVTHMPTYFISVSLPTIHTYTSLLNSVSF